MELSKPGRVGLGVALALALASAPLATEASGTRVGNEKCGECHKKERKAWLETKHARILYDADDDSVLANADAYAEKLGLDDIESAKECGGCHFNHYESEAGPEVGSVDCESCHGLASGWVDIHSDYGAKDGKAIEDPDQEDPKHREERWNRSVAAGMLRPRVIHALASNCLECHTGPGAKVVEAGHSPGSDFELVSWLGGEVRHNYHRTNQQTNAPVPQARRREMYLLGRALDLQLSLKKLAEAGDGAGYAEKMQARVTRARAELGKIQAALQNEAVASLLAAGEGAPGEAAKAVEKAVGSLATSLDGAALAPLDGLIPSEVKGEPFAE